MLNITILRMKNLEKKLLICLFFVGLQNVHSMFITKGPTATADYRDENVKEYFLNNTAENEFIQPASIQLPVEINELDGGPTATADYRDKNVKEYFLNNTAENEFIQPASIQLSVEINELENINKYSIRVASTPEQYVIGQRFEMSCRVTPQLKNSKYSWYKNDHLISNNDNLTFNEMTKEDLGTYKCFVEGVTETGSLMELEAFTDVITSEIRYMRYGNSKGTSIDYIIEIHHDDAIIGMPFSMQCEVSPKFKSATYSWYKNGKYLSNQQIFSLNVLKPQNMGAYSCLVRGSSENGLTDEVEGFILV